MRTNPTKSTVHEKQSLPFTLDELREWAANEDYESFWNTFRYSEDYEDVDVYGLVPKKFKNKQVLAFVELAKKYHINDIFDQYESALYGADTRDEWASEALHEDLRLDDVVYAKSTAGQELKNLVDQVFVAAVNAGGTERHVEEDVLDILKDHSESEATDQLDRRSYIRAVELEKYLSPNEIDWKAVGKGGLSDREMNKKITERLHQIGYNSPSDSPWNYEFSIGTGSYLVLSINERAAIEALHRKLDEFEDEVPYTAEDDWLKDQPIVEEYPRNVDAMQALRYLKRSKLDSIPVKAFRELPFGRGAWGQALVKSIGGRDITKGDIKQYSASTDIVAPRVAAIRSNAKTFVIPWEGAQRIFDNNKAFVYSVPWETAWTEVFHDAERVLPNTDHPYVDGYFPLGWVRFTLFRDKWTNNKDIWVDEIQTDLFDDYLKSMYSPAAYKAVSKELKPLLKDMVSEFFYTMRRLGYERIFIPNHAVADELYKRHGAPKYPYDILPTEFRMDDVGDYLEDGRRLMITELPAGLARKVHEIDGGGVWRLNPGHKRRKS